MRNALIEPDADVHNLVWGEFYRTCCDRRLREFVLLRIRLSGPPSSCFCPFVSRLSCVLDARPVILILTSIINNKVMSRCQMFFRFIESFSMLCIPLAIRPTEHGPEFYFPAPMYSAFLKINFN